MATDDEAKAYQLIKERIDEYAQKIEETVHAWSSRPCQTCRTVSLLIGRSFGCTAKSGKCSRK